MLSNYKGIEIVRSYVHYGDAHYKICCICTYTYTVKIMLYMLQINHFISLRKFEYFYYLNIRVI